MLDLQMSFSDRLAQRLALWVPIFLLGGAYISQYVFGLFPCEMCWWQRWPHFAALAFVALSFVIPKSGYGFRKILVALAGIAILASGLIGAFHAGVEYGWWEGLTTCSSLDLNGGSALDAILNAPIIRCDQAAWTLFGMSLAGFNALFSTGAALAIWSFLAGKDSKQA